MKSRKSSRPASSSLSKSAKSASKSSARAGRKPASASTRARKSTSARAVVRKGKSMTATAQSLVTKLERKLQKGMKRIASGVSSSR